MIRTSLCLSFVLAACTLEATEERAAPISAHPAEVVYGDDDRVDVHELDGRLREIAERSVVAIFARRTLDETDPARVQIAFALPLGKALGLCASERFRDEPFAASCSGTLIADDLVLTAGHCFGHRGAGVDPEEVCRGLRFAFGYYNVAPGQRRPMTSSDVFSCAELVLHRDDSAEQEDDRRNTGERLDFAVVRLDRTATPRFAPVKLDPDPTKLVPGRALTVLGFPSGIPLKAAANGALTKVRARGDFFRATLDTFAGSSGSGVFDAATLAQIGILVSGEPDYVRDGGCTRVARCDAAGCDGKRSERVTHVGPVLGAYCRRGDARAEVCARR